MKRASLVFAAAFGIGVVASGQPSAEPPVRLDQVVVTPSRFGVAEEQHVAVASLTSTELETLPQIGDDLFRSIARLPGLAADDFTAQFWVRGAPQSELLARYDGVDLVEPFHLKDVDGALSIVDPQTISRLDLLTGGFSAEFGNRLAAVLVMETKPATALRTTLGLSLTGVGGMNQGVIKAGAGQWLVAARRGYPDVALRFANREDEVDPRYYDVTGKFEYTLAPGQVLSVHVLHAGDTLRYHKSSSPNLRSGYDSDYLWTRWQGRFGERVTTEAVLALTRLTWSRDGSGLLDNYPFALRDHRRLDQASLRDDWSLRVDDQVLVRAGVEAKRGEARYDYSLSHQFTVIDAGRQTVATERVDTSLRPDGTSAGGFVSVRVQPASALVLEPGVRYDRHDFTGDSDASPRLNAVWTLGRTTVRGAWGEYVQAEGLHEIAVGDGETGFHRAERAEQRVVGIERPLLRGVSARVEVYERITRHVRPRWENLDNPYELFPEAQSDRILLAPSRARARGVELLLAGRGNPRLTWNASYALARSEEQLAGRWVPRARDQRHALYADLTYLPSTKWQFSGAWQYHSGWPTTDVEHSLVTLTNGRRVIVASTAAPYGLRMPAYHRLDLRATRRFATRRGEVRTFVDLFNVYDRRNVIGYDHRVSVNGTQVTDTKKAREQLPFLPSAGVSWEF